MQKDSGKIWQFGLRNWSWEWSKSSVVQPGVLLEEWSGQDPHRASKVQLMELGRLFRSKEMSLEVVFQCLKGSRVATTGLVGGKFQESPTKEGQGRSRLSNNIQPSLRQETPITGIRKLSQGDSVWKAGRGISAPRGRLHLSFTFCSISHS